MHVYQLTFCCLLFSKNQTNYNGVTNLAVTITAKKYAQLYYLLTWVNNNCVIHKKTEYSMQKYPVWSYFPICKLNHSFRLKLCERSRPCVCISTKFNRVQNFLCIFSLVRNTVMVSITRSCFNANNSPNTVMAHH